jgi:iron complex transport system permease protein
LPRSLFLVSVGGLVFLILSALAGLASGPAGLGLDQVWAGLIGTAEPKVVSIVCQVRLPRVILAGLAGAGLSLGGLVLQAVLRNPLAEPYILGVSGGAGVGAVSGILLGLPFFPGVGLSAFGGGLGVTALVLGLAGRRIAQREGLLLAGVMANAFCSAIILTLLSFSPSLELQTALYWLMGHFSLPPGWHLLSLALTVMGTLVVFFFLAQDMNILLIGHNAALGLGVRVRALVWVLLILVAWVISAIVALCGLIGFVGLVVPHILRLILGPEHRILVPACFFGGGGFLILCDILARTLPAQVIPVGVVTALVGAPLFVLLLAREDQWRL